MLSRDYSDLSFIELLRELERDEGLHFYYVPERIDSIHVDYVKKETQIEDALEAVLIETGLKFYIEESDIYIYEGTPIVRELPVFKDFQKKKALIASNKNDDITDTESKYLETKSISEKNLITIGDKKNFRSGRRALVSGKVSNKVSGESLIGATVFIKESGAGTITDVNGAFQLRLLPGKYSISVNHMAMKEMEYGLNILSDGALTIELENELIELQEITVINKRNDNVKGMLMGFDRISTKSMKEIPVVMGEKDILKVAQMLPGVQNVGEGSSGFNVRGGSADQNMFYINKISIYNTSHLFGFFTAFSPDIISDFSLYKNNIPSNLL